MNNYNDNFDFELSIEEYLFGYVNFCLTFGIELNNKMLDEALNYYTHKHLELDKYDTISDDEMR